MRRARARHRLPILRPATAFIVAVALSATSTAAAAAERVPVSEYVGRLERAVELARSGESDPSPGRIQQIREALGLPLQVELPGGTTVTVATDPILERATGDAEEDFRRARERLEALLDGARRAEGSTALDRRTLSAALARAYRDVQAEPNLFARLLRYARELLGWLLSKLLSGLVGAGGWWSVVAWLIVAGVIVGIAFLLRRVGLGVVPERRIPQEDYASQAVDWNRLAEEALRRGDLREAVRCLYHTLLASLAARGLVEDAPSLTAGETRIAVQRRQPGLFPAVARATDVFERVTYGERTPTDQEVADVRSAARLEIAP